MMVVSAPICSLQLGSICTKILFCKNERQIAKGMAQGKNDTVKGYLKELEETTHKKLFPVKKILSARYP